MRVIHYQAASLLVVTILYGWVAQRFVLAAPLAAVLVASVVLRARVALGRTALRVALVAAAALGLAVDWIVPAVERPDVLRRPWTMLAMMGLAVGAARLFLVPAKAPARPDDRSATEPAASPFTFLPGLVALMAAGETVTGPIYAVAIVAWLGLAIAAQRAGDRGRPALRDIPRRERLVALSLVALGVAFGAISIVGLPPLSRWMERRILRSLGGAETGFSERMWLGSLDGLLDSDEVVMRLEGPRTDYLRGAVFDHYEIGRWGRAHPPRPHSISTAAAGDGDDRVRLTVVAGARDRYFLPREAHALHAAEKLTADRFGIVRLDGGTATELSFAVGGPPELPTEDPTSDDLDIPPSLRRPIGQIAEAWTAGATTPETKIGAIAAHLAEGFTYSRTFQRRRADPILDFLIDDHRGHCEYFATATALLARSAGVPARVVIGYRVAEENVLGRYWVVREKNAHAWTEVYLPGKGFVTLDTTPADPLAQNAPHRTRWASAFADLVAAWWGRAIARITLLHVTLGGGVIIIVGLVVRELRKPSRKARERDAKTKADPPPPSLLRLLAALAQKGLVRGDAEPIERFAARLADAEQGEAAALLERWSAFRYGGIGDGNALARDMDAFADRTRRR
ncbi:Hypothetical protein A7982_02677 [Minicystis rosea]|nr:Hypothetical protein A7982_02677 [Minicystis rosea]